MANVFLSLGSNLDDKQHNLQQAIQALFACTDIQRHSISPLYETEPVGVVEQPVFYNCVVGLKTKLAPFRLLQVCLGVETLLGRQRNQKWGPRLIDIDILTYDQQIIRDDNLSLPHPELSKRKFILVPWNDIAPDWLVPGLGTVRELLCVTSDHSGVELIKRDWI